MRHTQPVTGPTAILSCPVLQFFSTVGAVGIRVLGTDVCFMIFFPPLYPAGVAAKTCDGSSFPCSPKLLAAVWAYTRRVACCPLLFSEFLLVMCTPACFAAEAPMPATMYALIQRRPAVDTGVPRRDISLGVVIFHTTGSATVFLSTDMTRRCKYFSAA